MVGFMFPLFLWLQSCLALRWLLEGSRQLLVGVSWKNSGRDYCLRYHNLPSSFFFKCTEILHEEMVTQVFDTYIIYILTSLMIIRTMLIFDLSELPSLFCLQGCRCMPSSPCLSSPTVAMSGLSECTSHSSDKESPQVIASCRFQGIMIKIIVLMSKSTPGQYFW